MRTFLHSVKKENITRRKRGFSSNSKLTPRFTFFRKKPLGDICKTLVQSIKGNCQVCFAHRNNARRRTNRIKPSNERKSFAPKQKFDSVFAWKLSLTQIMIETITGYGFAEFRIEI